ncbi:MAG: hypothetical protein VKL59_21585 [Nostocaceae cyanobacterium]|nr:hypothetical protein [Nostocaceae cyanobacterium]
MRAYTSNQATTNYVNIYSQNQNHVSVSSLMGYSIVIFILIILVAGKTYRGAIRRRRIATLETIWLMSCKNQNNY